MELGKFNSPEDPEEYILSSSVPEECYIAIPWLLDSSRNEIFQGIAIPTFNNLRQREDYDFLKF